MLDQGVLWIGQDRDQSGFVQIGQRGDHGQTAHEFRDQAEFQQIFRLKLHEQLTHAACVGVFHVSAKAHGCAFVALRDDLFQTGKSAAADEQDVGRINL